MNKISSQDRAALIRLASSLPKGSLEKRAILGSLRKGAQVDVDLLPTPKGTSWIEWNRPGQPKELILHRGYDGNLGSPLGRIVLKTTWQAYTKGVRGPISLGQRKPQFAAAEVVLELAAKGIVSTVGAEKQLAEFERLGNRPEIDIENFPTPAGCSWQLLKNNVVVLRQGSVMLGKIVKARSWQAWVEGEDSTISLGSEEPAEAAKELVDELVAQGVI